MAQVVSRITKLGCVGFSPVGTAEAHPRQHRHSSRTADYGSTQDTSMLSCRCSELRQNQNLAISLGIRSQWRTQEKTMSQRQVLTDRS
jgi:hypothetical protein